MNNPLRRGRLRRWGLRRGRPGVSAGRAQLAYDVLSGAVDSEDDTVCESAGLARRRIFEGLAMGCEPGLNDAVAAYADVHAASDRLHLGQFRHGLILVSHRNCPPAKAK